MSSRKKLLEKLKRGTLSAQELRTLLRQEGWELKSTVGSHEHWRKGQVLYTLATHTKELKKYMIQQAKRVLLGEPDENEQD